MSEHISLYHASTDPNIQVFEPREESPRYPGEGPLVFATPDKRVAAMFLAPKDGGPAEICKFEDKVMLVIQNSVEDFIAHDTGGAIYTLPVDTFTTDASIGMGEAEWVSRAPVKPLEKEVYSTSIDAMRLAGVKLFFVNREVMQKIHEAEDHGLSILRSLRPYLN